MSSLVTADIRATLGVAIAGASALALAGLAGVGPLSLLSFVAAVLLACLSPVGILLGAIATLPYFYRPLAISGQHLAASELLLLAAAFGTAVRIVVVGIKSRASNVRRLGNDIVSALLSPVVAASLVLVALGGLLVAFPYDMAHRAESLREWRWTMAEPALLLGLLVWHRRHPQLPELAALALIAGGAVASFHAIADLALGGGVSVGGVTRIAGPYPHPNALALMTARIAALALAWAALDPRVRRWIWPLLVCCVVAVAATFSRGAMLAGGVALALVLINASPRMRLASLASAGLAIVIAVAAARDRMLDLFDGGSGSLRLDIWSSAIRMIGDRPLIGYGPDQFLYAYLPRYVAPTSWGERFTAHAHNFLLDFWIRLGVVGAVFVIVAACLCLRATARHVQESGRHSSLKIAALVALSATLAQGLVDNAFFSHDLAMSVWLLAWLAFETGRNATGAEGGTDVAGAGIRRSRLHRLAFVRQPDR